MKLAFHREAELELIEAAARYEEQVEGLGERLGFEVQRVTDLLLRHPEIGARIEPDLRGFVLQRFPFTLIYSVSGDLLIVLAVAHQSRRPEYWRSRAPR